MLKRILVILLAVFVVFAMLSCDNGSTKKSPSPTPTPTPDGGIKNPILFENGEWSDELGNIEKDIGDVVISSEGIKLKDGGEINFRFEDPVDASAYSAMVFVFKEKNASDLGWWAGGQLFTFYDGDVIDDSAKWENLAKFGYWDGAFDNDEIAKSGEMTFTFSKAVQDFPDPDDEVFEFNAKKLYGFSVNGGDNGTIVKIYLK